MIIQLRREISWQNIAGKIFIINEENEIGVCLEESGVDFWMALIIGNTFEQILDELSKMYEVSEIEIREDFLELLNQLVSAGILDVKEDITSIH